MSGILLPRGPKHSSKLVRETQNNLAWWPSHSEPFHSSGSLVSRAVTQLTEENRFSCVGHLCTFIRAILEGNYCLRQWTLFQNDMVERVVSLYSCARNTVPKLCDPLCFLLQLHTRTRVYNLRDITNVKHNILHIFHRYSNFSSPVSHTRMWQKVTKPLCNTGSLFYLPNTVWRFLTARFRISTLA